MYIFTEHCYVWERKIGMVPNVLVSTRFLFVEVSIIFGIGMS